MRKGQRRGRRGRKKEGTGGRGGRARKGQKRGRRGRKKEGTGGRGGRGRKQNTTVVCVATKPHTNLILGRSEFLYPVTGCEKETTRLHYHVLPHLGWSP